MEPRLPDTRAGKEPPAGTPAPDGGIGTVPYHPPPESATRSDVTTHYPTPITRELAEELPVIKNYEVLHKIHGGGMGIVYRARHKGSGRTEALKTIRPELASGEHLDRFTREVQTVASLDHPNIIKIFHVGLDEKPPHYTMEFLAEGTLFDQRARFRGNAAKAAEVIEKITRAVHHAHERGICHRDLKPGNVLMKDGGEPIVTDFGLAKLREADVQLTRAGQPLGTPGYMSPEQFQGRADVGAPTDIWALGVMLYELLTGKRPFEGDSWVDVQQKVRDVTPVGVRQHNSSIDPVLERIVSKCLVKEPEWRFSSAGELAEHLRRWRIGDPIPIGRESVVRKVKRWIRKHPRISAVYVLLALAAGIALCARVYLDPERPLRNAYSELHVGRPVTLLASAGPPLWMHWITPAHPIEIFGEEKDRGYRISTASIDLLELLPTSEVDSFRLQAEVRHAADLASGEVGIYFARQFNNRVHFIWVFAFNDFQSGTDGAERPNQARLGIRTVQQGDRKSTPGQDVALKSFMPAGVNQQWRRLAIEVTSEGLELSWEGKHFDYKTVDELRRASKQLREGWPPTRSLYEGLRDEYTPGGGLGLYVNRSTVDFRNFVIQPLVR